MPVSLCSLGTDKTDDGKIKGRERDSPVKLPGWNTMMQGKAGQDGAASAKADVNHVAAELLGRPIHKPWEPSAAKSWSSKNAMKKSANATANGCRQKKEEERKSVNDKDQIQTPRKVKQRWGYRVAQLGLIAAAGFAVRDRSYRAAASCLGLFVAAEVAHEALDGIHETTYPVRVRVNHEVTDKSALYMAAGMAGAGDALGKGLAYLGSSTPSGDAEREGSLAWGIKKAKPVRINVLSPLLGVRN